MKKAAFLAILLASSTAFAEQRDKKSSEPSGGPIALGAIAGVGFPRPLTVEAIMVLGRAVGLGAEYSILPPINVSIVQVSMQAIAGDFRIFPFRSPVFFGVKGGLQRLDGGMSMNGFSQSMLAETWFVTPRIGALFSWRPGLAVGMEAGVQFPVATTTQMPSLATDEIKKLTDALASTALPTVDLLRIGLML